MRLLTKRLCLLIAFSLVASITFSKAGTSKYTMTYVVEVLKDKNIPYDGLVSLSYRENNTYGEYYTEAEPRLKNYSPFVASVSSGGYAKFRDGNNPKMINVDYFILKLIDEGFEYERHEIKKFRRVSNTHFEMEINLEIARKSPKGAGEAGKKTSTTAQMITNSVGMKLKLIKPGTFMMGSMRGEDDEKPVHKVTLTRPFYIGIYEVTQEQYEKVMGVNPTKSKGPKHPVARISCNDTQEFCRRLSKLESKQYRLPTEAEWEYACRAGTSTEFYWGDSFDGQYAWSMDNSDTAHDVGTRLPNAWGLYDMSGNVFEYCSDWFGNYPKGPVTDPKGPTSGKNCVFRGGSWGANPEYCRSAGRTGLSLDFRGFRLGFRIVMDMN